MVGHGSIQHQNLIAKAIDELNKDGYRAININGTAPDAIAIKDNKVYAVEALLIKNIPKKGWEHMEIVRKKCNRYHMFDDVIFKVEISRIKIIPNELRKKLKIQKNAKKIVEEFFKEYPDVIGVNINEYEKKF